MTHQSHHMTYIYLPKTKQLGQFLHLTIQTVLLKLQAILPRYLKEEKNKQKHLGVILSVIL